MTLSDISIKNPVFAWMIMAACMVFGLIAFLRLGVDQYPDVDAPVITVTITREGAAPEIMESEVADVVEDVVMTVEGVKEVTSSSQEGKTTVTIEFYLSRNIDAALQDVESKVTQVQKLLPHDIDPPVITKTNPDDQPIMWIGLVGHRSPQELSDFARYTLKEQLQAVPGVAEIMMGGYLDRNIRVWLDGPKLEAYHLTVDDVIQAIQREHIEVPAGRIESTTEEFNVRFKGEAPTVGDFQNIIIADDEGKQIRLRDVALVENGLEDQRRIARSMGVPAQGLGIKKMRGANAVAVAQAVRARVEEIKKNLPPDLHLSVVFDGTQFIKDSISEIELSLLLSVLLTALVCWFFLGSVSSTLNVVLAIPTSLLGTFAVMYFSGFTLNMITLLALSLVIGVVVDDSIMVLENIYRHAEKGLSRLEAATVGAREITFAALAASLALVAIFLPVAFMSGLIGKFFFQFGITISVAVLFSYLEAVTLTPSRCSQMLQVGERRTPVGRLIEKSLKGLSSLYGRLLPFCLRWRYALLGISLLLFISSLSILRLLGKEFIPGQDQSRFLVTLKAPLGSSIHTTNHLDQLCEQYLMTLPEVKQYFTAVGGFAGGDVDTAILFVTLVPPNQRTRTQEQVINLVRKKFNSIPGLRAIVLDLSRQDPSGRRSYPVELTLKGPDWNVLGSSSQKVMKALNDSGFVVDVDSDYRVGMPEIDVIPDRQKAADAHVSMESLGNVINALVGGIRVAKFEDHGRRYDVRVRLLRSQRLRQEDINPLLVRTQTGKLMPLRDLVHLQEIPVLQSITRRQRQRAITLTANMAPGVAQAVALEHALSIAQKALPEGYHAELTGGSQTFSESFNSLIFALGLGILVAYMVLASQFNSFIHPFTVFVALPFSITGALLALWMGGYTLNIFSMLGVILLIGIVKKNSIILVDYTNQRRREGLPSQKALLEACPTRLRPILMTSVATIAGAIPPALALGPGGELRTPMAISIIGGLALSTLLTLFVVPSVYSIFEDIKSLFGKNRA